MFLLRFIHDENQLSVGDKVYKATCPVRNALNGERAPGQVVKTYPKNPLEERLPYDPRKFPTGFFRVKSPIWIKRLEEAAEFGSVKIPTDATRRVLTTSGKIQEDAFYHLHYAPQSRTTLGCIRLNSDLDAIEIATTIMRQQKAGEAVWLEVIASTKCYRG